MPLFRRARPTGSAAVADHHHRFFARHSVTEQRAAAGPVLSRVPGFFVHEIAPGPRYGAWTYASVGVWDSTHAPDGHGVEFVLAADEPSERLVELLAMTAYYHAGPPSQRLAVGHTVPIGEPWLPGSACDHLLISQPYPFGPELETCAWQGGHARLLWALPITSAEREYKAQHGLDALEERLEQAEANPTDTGRRSVVCARSHGNSAWARCPSDRRSRSSRPTVSTSRLSRGSRPD